MTNQLCLQQQCGRLYKKLLRQLTGYETTITDEEKWIEWGFGITTKTWFGIQHEIDDYVFDDQQEEIAFYKVVKPRFIALIDYFTLLYISVLFQPDDLPGKKEVILFNLKGVKVAEQTIDGGKAKFHVADLASAVYFVRVTTGKRVKMIKFVKN